MAQDNMKAGEKAGEKAQTLRAPEGVETFKDEATGDVTERWTDKEGQRWEKTTIGTHSNPEKQRQRPGTYTLTKCEELRFFYGQFQAASQTADQQIVKVWYRGNSKQFNRGVLVIVPSTILGVCGIANQERFKMEPGMPLKKLAPYNPYGFFVDFTKGRNGEATEAEYEKRISEGTEQNRMTAVRGVSVSQT